MLYSLKQSGHECNDELNKKLTKKGFCQFVSDPCAYCHEIEGHIGIMTVWVDDLILFANNQLTMDCMLSDLKNMFEIMDLGELRKIVRIEITIDEKTGTVKLTQTKYIEMLLQKYTLEDANGVAVPMDPNIKLFKPNESSNPKDRSNTYASLVGSLMFIAVTT